MESADGIAERNCRSPSTGVTKRSGFWAALKDTGLLAVVDSYIRWYNASLGPVNCAFHMGHRNTQLLELWSEPLEVESSTRLN
jgi:hypothetical protein